MLNMSKIRSALIFSFAAKYGMQFLSLASAIVVARLLVPDEIGVFAIASSVVLVISEFRLLGAGVYVIREAELTRDKVKNALGLSFLICWCLGIALILLSSFLGEFYGNESISNIFIILSISFFFGPYISISASLLSREFQHKTIFHVRIITGVVGFITTVSLILLGASYYSMAISNLVSVIVQFCLYIWFRPKTMELLPSFGDFKPIMKVGIFHSLSSMLNRTQLTLSDIIIGRIGTVRDVAIFSRGLGFINFISDTVVSGVSPVVLPYLSKVNKDKGSVSEAYTKAGVYLTGITWPVLLVANVVALPAIRLFFGDQWDEAAPIAAILACWAAIRSSNIFFSQAMLAKSMEKILFVKEVMIFCLLGVSIWSFYPYGFESVGYAFVCVSICEFVICLVLLVKFLDLKIFDYFRSLFKSAGIAIVCFLAASIIDEILELNDYGGNSKVFTCALILPIVWILCLYVLKHPLFEEIARIFKFRLSKS